MKMNNPPTSGKIFRPAARPAVPSTSSSKNSTSNS
jgi:hypothetical protein